MKYIVCSDEEITDEMLNQIKEILLESRNPRDSLYLTFTEFSYFGGGYIIFGEGKSDMKYFEI